MPTSTETATSAPAALQATERILAAAEMLFSEQGFDAVSISDIARQAAVSKANVFHHFTNKRALYLAVVSRAVNDFTRALEEIRAEQADLNGQLEQFIFLHLAKLIEHHRVVRLLRRELLDPHPGSCRDLAEQGLADSFAAITRMLRQAQAAGQVRASVDVALVATVIIAANDFYRQARGILQHFPDVTFADDPARFSRMLLDLMLHGMVPTAQAAPLPAGQTPPE